MAYRSWEQIADDVMRSVRDAVDSGHFAGLNRRVSGQVNQRTGGRSYGGTAQSGTYRTQQPASADPSAVSSSSLYVTGSAQQLADLVLVMVGAAATLLFFMAFIGLLMDPWSPMSVLFFCLLMTFAGAAAAIFGAVRLKQLRRFRRYVSLIGGRQYADVRQMSEQLSIPLSRLRRDLRTMIRRRWFLQGYLDPTQNCLILSYAAYEQYQTMMESQKRQNEEEAARRQQQKKDEQKQQKTQCDLPPEVQEILRDGEAYLKQVHSINDEIPAEEVSQKISRMEMVLKRIFSRLREHPESAGDLRRLMDYYLPMTIKLLGAYRDMDASPVHSPNVTSSLREIEQTLDTLNAAFEKLLDDLFTETAWDLSSDISVLYTLLSQDGLK